MGEKFALVTAVKSWRRNIGQKWLKTPDVQLSIGMCFRMPKTKKMMTIRKRIKIRRKMVEKRILTGKGEIKTEKMKKLVKGTTKRQKKRKNETTLIMEKKLPQKKKKKKKKS